MAVFSGEIGAKIKLALFSHRFDKEIGKIIIDRLVFESNDDEFLTKNYKKEGQLDTEKLIQDFLGRYYIDKPKEQYGQGINQQILCVCMAIQGLVEGEKGNRTASVSRPNLEVTFTESDFQKSPISYAPVTFLNDMPSIGESIFLPEYESKFTRIDQKGKIEEKGRKGLLLVGEGLGAALWFFYNAKEKMDFLSTEYGHTCFCSRTKDEKIIAEVLQKFRPIKDVIDPSILQELGLSEEDVIDPSILQELGLSEEDVRNLRNQHISKEYALSEPGFVRIYEVLKTPNIYNQETGEFQYSEEVGNLPERLLQSKNIAPKDVIEKAINKSDSLAVKTLEIFVGIMGSVAGDFALINQAKGGIYMGGCSSIFNLIKEDSNLKEIFLKAFADREKGFCSYNQAIPVFIYDFDFEGSPLMGAARYAVDQGLVTKGKFAYEKYQKQSQKK